MAESGSGYSAAELAPWAVEVHELLSGAGVAHVLIGGAVVQLYAKRARTRDVDYLVRVGPERVASLRERLTEAGLRVETKAPWHLRAWKSDILYADLVVAEVPVQDEIIDKAVLHDVAGSQIPLATPEHLIVLKVIAGRPRDLRDVEDVRESVAQLDDAEIARMLAEFDLAWPPTTAS